MYSKNDDKHYKENNTEYAKNIEEKELHISQIEKENSGRKGYYCIGCNREMEAVLPKRYKSYFRHSAKDVKHKGKCSFSNESYRHKIAKDILQRIKRIKVPSLYKFPPKSSDQQPNFIRESHYIEAHTVKIERNFFEDEHGNIRWERNLNVEERNLEFRPDVSFFDKEEKPILLIEIVAKHKLPEDKKVKIRRLGIDTIQVNIPKDSVEEIEKCFHYTSRTKWIYNNEEANTNYIPIPNGDSEIVPPIDEQQRKFLEESYSCRSSQIGNLIRSINRCLESELYISSELELRNKLQRVEENTERARIRLEAIQNKLREEVDRKFRNEKERLNREEKEFQTDYSELEGRYLRKKREDTEVEDELCGEIERSERNIQWNRESSTRERNHFEEEQRRVESEIRRVKEEAETVAKQENDIDEAILEEKREILRYIGYEKRDFRREEERITEEESGLSEEFRRRRASTLEEIKEQEKLIEKSERDFPNEDGRAREQEIREIEQSTKQIDSRREKIRRKRKKIPNTKQGVEREVEQRFEELRERTSQSVKERVCKRDGGFRTEFKKVLHFGELLLGFEEDKRKEERVKEANKLFRQGVYKKWFKP